MDDYQIPIGVIDLSIYWRTIQPVIIQEGPLLINPQISSVLALSDPPPYFSPNFSEGTHENALFHLFVLPYDSKFDTNLTTSISIWRSQHQDSLFLVCILSLAKSQWSFTSQKSKIESLFQGMVPSARMIIVKYYTDSLALNDSDVKVLHREIENICTIGYQEKISTFQKKCQETSIDSPEYPTAVIDLAHIYTVFGFYKDAATMYRNLSYSISLPFWPEKPKIYDVRRINYKIKFLTGYEIMITALHGIVRSILEQKKIFEASHDFTNAFATILSNAETPEQQFFARHWIHFTSVNFCDMLESNPQNIKSSLAPSFSMIALHQIVQIIKIHVDKNDPFLAEVAKGIAAVECDNGRDQLFITEWSRARKNLDDFQNHQLYLNSLFFKYLLNKNDIKGAFDMIKNTRLSHKEQHPRYWSAEINVLLNMFEIEKHKQKAAELLISSSASTDIKLAALEFLSKDEAIIRPKFVLHQRIHVPEFYSAHRLFETVHCTVSLNIPVWMVGLKCGILFQLRNKTKNDDYAIVVEPIEQELTKKIVLRLDFNCNLAGVFDVMDICISYRALGFVWNVPLPVALHVIEPKSPPSFDLKMPCLLSKGATQSAVLMIDQIDSENSILTFSFEMPSLIEIRYVDIDQQLHKYGPNDEVVLTKFEANFQIVLVYQLNDDDECINMNCKMTRSDGKTNFIFQSFEIPHPTNLHIRLFKQTEKHQQFQIVNKFPVSFKFEYNGNSYTMSPSALSYLIRPKSNSPLVLTLVENGWEEFPVEIVTSSFVLNQMTINLTIENNSDEWIVGEPRLVHVDPPAYPMMEEESNWIVAPQDTIGATHLLIPRGPGHLLFPKFLVQQQVAISNPKSTTITNYMYPPFIPL